MKSYFRGSLLSPERISLVISQYSGGGAEGSMRDLATYFRSCGFAVQVVAINKSPEVEELVHIDDVCVEREKSDNLLKTWHRLRGFKRSVESFQPSAIVLNCEISELFGVLLAKPPLGIYVVEHTTRPWVQRRLLGLLVRFVVWARRFRWITVVRDQMNVWPLKQLPVYIPNPVVASPTVATKSVDLVFVGRLSESKHPEILLQLAKEFNASVDFFGNGDMRGFLEMQSLGLQARYWGYVPEPWKHIGLDSIVVFASDFEGDGKAVIEAILHGNPFLLKDTPDFRRMNLAPHHYFKDLEELKMKVAFSLQGDRDVFRSSREVADSFGRDRSLASVSERWRMVFGFKL